MKHILLILLLSFTYAKVTAQTIYESVQTGNWEDLATWTTITYQVVKGFPLEKALRFAEDYGIPKPDLVIYIDVPVEVGIERKKKDKGKLDVHESDIEFLKKVREKYLENAKNNVFGKWIVINGNKSIDEVTQDIIDVIGEFLDLS